MFWTLTALVDRELLFPGRNTAVLDSSLCALTWTACIPLNLSLGVRGKAVPVWILWRMEFGSEAWLGWWQGVVPLEPDGMRCGMWPKTKVSVILYTMLDGTGDTLGTLRLWGGSFGANRGSAEGWKWEECQRGLEGECRNAGKSLRLDSDPLEWRMWGQAPKSPGVPSCWPLSHGLRGTIEAFMLSSKVLVPGSHHFKGYHCSEQGRGLPGTPRGWGATGGGPACFIS